MAKKGVLEGGIMRRITAFILVLFIAMSTFAFVGKATGEEDQHLYQIGVIGIMPDDYIGAFALHTANTYESDYKSDLSFPMQGMAITPDGNIAVCDTSYGRVHILNKNLQNILTFGELGTGEGKLQYPADIAVDADGNFYVADFFNNYWAKFDKNGKCLLNAGSEGKENGQFNGPSGIAVTNDGLVFVSDQLNHRIQVFDKDGNFKSVLQTEVGDPGGMCVDPSDNLYVVDMRACSVFKLDKTGKTLLKFGESGAKDGQFIYPFDVSVDKQGSIYVLDRGLGKTKHAVVQKFDSSGKFISKFGGNANIPQSNGTFLTPGGFAVDNDGNVYVIDSGYFYSPGNPFGYPIGVRLTKFDSSGNFASKVDFDVNETGRLMNPWSACEDFKGNIWVASWTNFSDTGEVDIFTPDGRFIKAIKGISDNEPFKAIGGIASDGKGNIYIGLGDYVAKFDENGNFIAKIGENKVSNVFQVAVDSSGNIWAASNGTQAVVGFKPDGTFISQFSPAHAPVGLFVDAKNNFYITTTDDNKVYIYGSDGKLKGSFGGGGKAVGKFWVPYGITVGQDGNILVADTENGRIQAFKGDTFELLWSTPREFYEPAMMSWTKNGNLLVADCFHNVVRILSTKAPVQANFDFVVRSSIFKVEVKPGESIKFNLVLRNTGSSDDSYTVNLENKLLSGWTVSPIAESFSVKAKDLILIPVTVTVSLTASPKDEGTLVFTFASVSDPSKTRILEIKIQTPDVPPVNVNIVGDKVPLGKSAVIDIKADKVEGLYGVSVTLSYDNDLLKVENIEAGGILGADAIFLENHSKAGTMIIGYSLKGNIEGVSAAGSLAKITLTGLKEGTSQLQVVDLTLYNNKGGIIRSTTSDISLTVYNPAPPALAVNITDGTTVSDSSFSFTGKTDSGCTVTVNGKPVTVSSDGSFSAYITLSEGANSIAVVATSKYGVTTKVTKTVYLKTSTVIVLQIGSQTFTVNGETRTLDSPPIIKNGRTLLPIRAVIEALDGQIEWNGTERKVTISLKGTTIELWIGKPQAKVNGELKWIDDSNHKVAPEIINSRTMLPLRFIAESLGAKVDWEGTTKTITITYPAP